MKKHHVTFGVAVLLVAALLANTVLFAVDEKRDVVLIATFNSIGEPIRGSEPGQAGLHVKAPWPIQKVVRYDSRQMVFEDALQEVSTSDKQNVLVMMFCAWRIDDPAAFYRSVKTESSAEKSLQDRLRATKADVIARRTLSDLVNTDPAHMKLTDIESEIRKELAAFAASYGIEITQLGVKQLGLSARVSETVIQAQIKEREQEAQTYQTAGEATATAIVGRARAASDTILAFARRDAAIIRTEGALNAARSYDAFRQNEKLSMYLRLLETIQTGFSRNTELLLDSTNSSLVPLPPSMEALGLPTEPASGGGGVTAATK
jgi:regulator of protease activity HflC (stomatin/prohibitin superfamily)